MLKSGFWLRGFCWFLAVMFIFTVVSRTASALTTAKVTVCNPSERKLQYTVLVEGRIEKNREIAVLTQPDILVKSVLVSEGEYVKKGEVLARLDMSDLDEQISSIEDEREILVLQNKALQKNKKQAKEEDTTIKINNISIKQLEKKLIKYNKIKSEKGRILAGKAGVITSVFVNVGQKTADTGAFLMADYSAGLKFEGQISSDDAKYLETGDKVVLKASDKEEEVTITSLKMDESKEFVNVVAFVSAQTFSIGETVNATSVRESEKYSCSVPVTAVYQSDGKTYVMLVQKEDTILGECEVARKMEVKVLEKNDVYAALEDGVLDSESKIISDSDRFVEAGDRVVEK